MPKALAERLAHWKSVLAMPRLLAGVSGAYTLLGALTWARDELVRHNPGESVWHVVDFLPHWSLSQWACGALLIIVGSILESSYRNKRSLDKTHSTKVSDLKAAILKREGDIEALNAKLRAGPAVMLSNVGAGVELRVESIREDAVNVRLVPAQSRNYYIDSDVVRTLRTGTQETFVLHCHAKERGGSLVHQAFAAPTLFFNDLIPPMRARIQRAL